MMTSEVVRWLMSPAGGPDDLPTLEDLLGRPAWQREAACRGQAAGEWVRKSPGADYGAQRAICAGCPVRQPCLDYALALPDLMGLLGRNERGGAAGAAAGGGREPRLTLRISLPSQQGFRR